MSHNTIFYIARHGQTDWNVERRIQGHKNSVLTNEGKQQAELLSNKLKDIHFDAIFASDLDRAKHTAEIVAAERSLAVRTTKELRGKAMADSMASSLKRSEKN